MGKMSKEHYKQPAEIKIESEMPRRKKDKRKKKKVLDFSRVKCLQHRLLLHKAAWHLATEGMPCHGTGLSLPTPTQLPPRDLLITGVLDSVHNNPRRAVTREGFSAHKATSSSKGIRWSTGPALGLIC